MLMKLQHNCICEKILCFSSKVRIFIGEDFSRDAEKLNAQYLKKCGNFRKISKLSAGIA